MPLDEDVPSPLWQAAKETVNVLYPGIFIPIVAFTAAQIWLNRQQNCYGYVVGDSRYKTPGEMAGQPMQAYTCSAALAGAKADGFQEPVAYAPDGCSVTCPPGSYPAYLVVGEVTFEAFGAPLFTFKDFHWYKEDETAFPDVETGVEPSADPSVLFSQVCLPNEDFRKIYSSKSGELYNPTNLDESGNPVTCPPEADHNGDAYQPLSIIPVKAKYNLEKCGYACASTKQAQKKVLSR